MAVLTRELSPNRLRANYVRILKLLYLAERRCLRDRGRSLLGDRIVAMRHGPVMSEVYDLIRNRHHWSIHWNAHFLADDFDLVLESDSGNGRLSPFEIELIESIADQYAGHDQWELVELCHTLDEWRMNEPNTEGGSPPSVPIPLDDILEAIGLADQKAEIHQRAAEAASINELYGLDAKPA